MKKLTFVKEIIFPQILSMDTWSAVLTTLLNFFRQKAGICFTLCLQKMDFSQTNVSLKLIPWKRRMHFKKRLRKESTNSRIIPPSARKL